MLKISKQSELVKNKHSLCKYESIALHVNTSRREPGRQNYSSMENEGEQIYYDEYICNSQNVNLLSAEIHEWWIILLGYRGIRVWLMGKTTKLELIYVPKFGASFPHFCLVCSDQIIEAHHYPLSCWPPRHNLLRQKGSYSPTQKSYQFLIKTGCKYMSVILRAIPSPTC